MNVQTWWIILPFLTFLLGFIAGQRSARDRSPRPMPQARGCTCGHSATGAPYANPNCPVHKD